MKKAICLLLTLVCVLCCVSCGGRSVGVTASPEETQESAGVMDALNEIVDTLKGALETDAQEEEPAEEPELRTIPEEPLQYPGQNDEWSYDVYKTYVVLRGYIGTSDVVEIPEEIEGLPVVKVDGDDSKYASTDIRRLIIPPGIIEMGKRIADYDYWDFEVVFLSENKVTYTDTPFSQTGLSSESAQAIMDHLAGNEIPDFFFYDCQYIESVVIPDGITYIGVYALPGSLRIMDFGNAEAAFSDCFDGGVP